MIGEFQSVSIASLFISILVHSSRHQGLAATIHRMGLELLREMFVIGSTHGAVLRMCSSVLLLVLLLMGVEL